VTQGEDLPVGSAVVVCSVTQLPLMGLTGYVAELVLYSVERGWKDFLRGITVLPGVPVLLGV